MSCCWFQRDCRNFDYNLREVLPVTAATSLLEDGISWAVPLLTVHSNDKTLGWRVCCYCHILGDSVPAAVDLGGSGLLLFPTPCCLPTSVQPRGWRVPAHAG